MTTFQRFKIYIISVIFGFGITFFILKKKNVHFNYTPNQRVIANISKKYLIFKDTVSFRDTVFIKNIFLKDADIDFSKSNIHSNTNEVIYFIENKNQQTIKNISIRNYKDKDTAEILSVK